MMNRLTRCCRLVLLPVLLCLAACDRVEQKLIERAAARNLVADHTEFLTDGNLHVILCGTGSPVIDRDRAAACTAVIAGNHFVLVDTGSASWREVALSHLPRANLEAVLLTHFHSDHIGDLGEATVQSWISGRTKPLVVYGPPGVERVVAGFSEAYALDSGYRTAHHGAAAMPPSGSQMVASTLPIPELGKSEVVFEADGLRVTAFAVDHKPVEPAFGYRFDYKGRSVVVSGDTKKDSNVVTQSKGADVLLHEGLARNIILPVSVYAHEHGLERWGKLSNDITTYHASPVDAAEVARDAGVKMLVFTHMVPAVSNFLTRRLFLRGVSDTFSGKVELGYDRMHMTLAPNSTEVKISSM